MTARKHRTARAAGIFRMLALAFALLAPSARAAAFKLLTIGDSLSDEYGSSFSVFFSAPDSDPLEANASNWVELLHQHRPGLFSMGTEGSIYLDYRYNGYEYNYGSVGFKAERWDQLLLSTPFNLLDINTKSELTGDLASVDAILIFLGGNDLSLTNTDAQHDVIRQSIVRIHSYVRTNAPGKPIIIATVPDIGATHMEKLSDPVQAAAARQRVATLNANIVALGSLPNTYIARIDALTDRIFDQQPFHINGTVFTYYQLPEGYENPPLHIFCKDGFHPGTGAQALIANEILKAINTFAATPIPLFTNREILADVLLQNPIQPYLDWAGAAGGFHDNPDNDANPNLIEFLLGTNPSQPGSGLTFLPGGTASYTPSENALRFADLQVLQSATLESDWIPVPAQNIQTLPNGTVNLIPSGPRLFYKFAASPKP